MCLAFPTPFSSSYMLFKRRGNSIFCHSTDLFPFKWRIFPALLYLDCPAPICISTHILTCFLWKIALLFVMAQGPQNETWWWHKRPQTFQILYLVFFNIQHEHDRILVLPIQYHLYLRRAMEKISCNWLSSTLTITL